jgi:Transposase IS116/IS110/IS902 family
VIGTPERFHCGKQIASYLGLVPEEKSSGERRRLGHISKQGNVLLRFLLVEAAQVTVRSQPEWRSKFFHLAMRPQDCQGRDGAEVGGASVQHSRCCGKSQNDKSPSAYAVFWLRHMSPPLCAPLEVDSTITPDCISKVWNPPTPTSSS